MKEEILEEGSCGGRRLQRLEFVVEGGHVVRMSGRIESVAPEARGRGRES